MKTKLTRNRTKPPAWSFSGLDLASWRAQTDLVTWAQTSPHFRDILTVLTNERRRVYTIEAGVTENRALGRLEGYESALQVLRALADGLSPETKPELEPTYPADAPPADWQD